MTAHITATKEEIAKVVIMPGDPLRAKWIAENFLDNYNLVNEVRGMLAYTGTYQGKKVTVMGHGMGNPSIGIYSYELYKFYDVDLIIRIGSAGSYKEEIKIGDVILTEKSYSDSTYAQMMEVPVRAKTIKAQKDVNKIIIKVAKESKIKIIKANVHASDVFYSSIPLDKIIEKSKCDVVEMEGFALFVNAIKLEKKAACILTCSDSLITHEALSPQERQTSFSNMVRLALNVSKKFS